MKKCRVLCDPKINVHLLLFENLNLEIMKKFNTTFSSCIVKELGEHFVAILPRLGGGAMFLTVIVR